MDLANNQLCGLDPVGRGTYTAEGIKAIADALRVNASLTFCNLLNNQMDVASAQLLVAAVKDKDVSLASIKPDQTERDFSHKNLRPPDTVLLASDLSKPGVSASLTSVRTLAHEPSRCWPTSPFWLMIAMLSLTVGSW